MTGETTDILTFELEEVSEHRHVSKIVGNQEKPKKRTQLDSWLNTLQVTPMLDPEAPIEPEDSSKSTKNVFKATFGEVTKYKCLVVVILPYRVPDNICHFAAQEATMVIDQFLKPDFETQINMSYQIEPDVFKKLDVYFSSIIYQV